MSLFSELKSNVEPGPYFEEDSRIWVSTDPPVRLVAYFLPQFHRIPENDLWWGKGFTEWTNVSKSYPQFSGHYQPHLPGELGFYDLSDPETLYRQAALARRYGVHGFCIHHYWFNGKRLLEKPLKNLLDHPDIDIQFCINWANDNWSRRWDGSDHEVLISQKYSPEDDIALARSLEAALADHRYIRINGRPLLMLYRPGLLPDARATVERWRNHFDRVGLGNPYIIMPQAFGTDDPKELGMDAAAGFPPHQSGFGQAQVRRWRRLLGPRHKSIIRSYDEMVRRALANRPDFTYFPGVCPSWDNHARRQKGGQVFVGSTPQKYGEWLRGACEYILSRSAGEERLVFVNAWNEWAEGTHLEPDRYYGYAFLAETARVLNGLPSHSAVLPEPQSHSLSVPRN